MIDILKKRLRIFKKPNNDREILDFYSNFIEKGDLCFDVGANVGNRTEIFLKSGATVVCIEPEESCFINLHQQYGNNPNVILINKGLAEKEGYLTLHISENATTISTMSDKWITEGRFSNDFRWTKTQLVPVTTLDCLVKTYGTPKFCKIDVEGYEYQILRGLSKPIPYISFEFTREFFEDAKKCINHLLSINQAKFNCSIGESYQFLFPFWTTPEELYDQIDSIEEKLLWGDIYVNFFDFTVYPAACCGEKEDDLGLL
jgi:FkbM family methyltransferase